MEGTISTEEGLATGIVLSVEEGETVTRALQIMTRHAEGIRDSGRPGAAQAAEIVAQRVLPFAQMFQVMLESGMVLLRKEPEDMGEIMDLLTPDPWGQAGGE